jgi:hypothetical protein
MRARRSIPRQVLGFVTHRRRHDRAQPLGDGLARIRRADQIKAHRRYLHRVIDAIAVFANTEYIAHRR